MEDFDFDFENSIMVVDSHHGVYQPKIFVECYRHLITGVSKDTLSELTSPDNEHYWEAWEDLLNTATVTSTCGKSYRVEQIEDVWLVPLSAANMV